MLFFLIMNLKVFLLGGSFTEAGGVPANNVAQWHIWEESWSALGSGVDDTVNAVAAAGGIASLEGNSQPQTAKRSIMSPNGILKALGSR